MTRRSLPAVDWELLAKRFPSHKEHIMRVRKDPYKLARLAHRLIGDRVRGLRALRDGRRIRTISRRPTLSLIFSRVGLRLHRKKA